ncbi:MAG TPA: hypothetical protein VFU89_06370 [Rhabdochlamydiaceae bacterium]|nr:hypothetical protein [Rhabdochlamydiaceae bacterium]
MATSAAEEATAQITTPPRTPSKHSASPTSKVAQPLIAAKTSTPLVPPLTDVNPEKYPFEAALKTAERTLLEDKRKEALKLFETIFQYLQKTPLPKNSLYSVRCLLGLALSTDSDEDIKQHAFAAYKGLKELVENYNEVEKSKASSFYSELKWHLQKVQPLIEKKDALMDIEVKITFCKNKILLIDEVKEQFKEGKELKIKGDKTCRDAFKNVLAQAGEKNGIEFRAVEIECLLMLTSSYQKESSKRDLSCARSQIILFKFYDERSSLYEFAASKAEAIRWLIDCLESLMELTSSTKEQIKDEIQQKIATCQSELDALPPPPAATDFTAPEPASARKVTTVLPNVNNSLGALFISCACFVLVAVVSMAFYRCSVTVSK